YYNPAYIVEPTTWEVWPGKLTYADTPIDPIGNVLTECTLPDGSPELFNVSGPALSGPVGPVGTQITINGLNFGSNTGARQVTLDGTPQAIVSWADTQIVFTIG